MLLQTRSHLVALAYVGQRSAEVLRIIAEQDIDAQPARHRVFTRESRLRRSLATRPSVTQRGDDREHRIRSGTVTRWARFLTPGGRPPRHRAFAARVGKDAAVIGTAGSFQRKINDLGCRRGTCYPGRSRGLRLARAGACRPGRRALAMAVSLPRAYSYIGHWVDRPTSAPISVSCAPKPRSCISRRNLYAMRQTPLYRRPAGEDTGDALEFGPLAGERTIIDLIRACALRRLKTQGEGTMKRRTYPRLLDAALGLAVATAMVIPAGAAAASATILPPQSRPFGATYGQWDAR